MKRLVLVGAGHAHAQVLLEWTRRPWPGVELVVVSPQALAPYSGMVPGWLAGMYKFEDIVINFPALCQRAGVRWVQDELQSLDTKEQTLHLKGGEQLHYDVLSLNVGSTLRPPEAGAAQVLSLRPLAQLRESYEGLLSAWAHGASHGSKEALAPYLVTAVGGGAAGFESILAVLARLRALQPQRQVTGRLLSKGKELLPGLSSSARRAAERALQRAQVTLELQTTWNPERDANASATSSARTSNLLLWATGAEAHDWQRDPQRRGSLAVSQQGFIRINAQLQSASHPNIFAVGDCAHWDTGTKPLPKAGVFAVRMGPVLTRNLHAALTGQAIEPYVPQRQFLVLLATGGQHAIASRGGLGAQGRWAWRWKDHIDRGFIGRFAAQG
jgi:pyridine nucleotide-disulfide oxidoreductase family protein